MLGSAKRSPFALIEPTTTNVPFFRPQLSESEINNVVETLRSGWLTTGPQVKEFELEFSKAVRAQYAIALNSCTAALHLAAEAIGLRENQGVLVPSMTFAATAEIVLYKGAIPILVDCDPVTGNIDLQDAEDKIRRLRDGSLDPLVPPDTEVVGIIPVHVGGYMLDIGKVKEFATRHGLWVIEDAAHAFPAAWRPDPKSQFQYCGENTADVTCFSFYANKTITTGEGGMAVTNDLKLADRIRLLSLHGLSHDAWGRYSGKGSWDYKIVAPGYKYNLTDIAASIGRGQLSRAEEMRSRREAIARFYIDSLAGVREFELPPISEDRIHSWHLFPIRLRLRSLTIDRDRFMEELKDNGVGCSVHWRPLHLHPLYRRFGWKQSDLPVASSMWKQLVSLPLYSSMTAKESSHVVETVKRICAEHTKRKLFLVA
ncbi:MAG: DegT/DnrJ/EryC1/StrS family aminotransferase [Pyrinomonadaceae bacterium]